MSPRKIVSRVIAFLIFTVFLGLMALVSFFIYQLLIDKYNNQTALQHNSSSPNNTFTPMTNLSQPNVIKYDNRKFSVGHIDNEYLEPSELVGQFLHFNSPGKRYYDEKLKKVIFEESKNKFMEIYESSKYEIKIRKEELINELMIRADFIFIHEKDGVQKNKTLEENWKSYNEKPNVPFFIQLPNMAKISNKISAFFDNNSFTDIFEDLKGDYLAIVKYLMDFTLREIERDVNKIAKYYKRKKTCTESILKTMFERVKSDVKTNISDVRLEIPMKGVFTPTYKVSFTPVRIFYPKLYNVYMFLMITYINENQDEIFKPFYDMCNNIF